MRPVQWSSQTQESDRRGQRRAKDGLIACRHSAQGPAKRTGNGCKIDSGDHGAAAVGNQSITFARASKPTATDREAPRRALKGKRVGAKCGGGGGVLSDSRAGLSARLRSAGRSRCNHPSCERRVGLPPCLSDTGPIQSYRRRPGGLAAPSGSTRCHTRFRNDQSGSGENFGGSLRAGEPAQKHFRRPRNITGTALLRRTEQETLIGSNIVGRVWSHLENGPSLGTYPYPASARASASQLSDCRAKPLLETGGAHRHHVARLRWRCRSLSAACKPDPGATGPCRAGSGRTADLEPACD